MCRDHRNGGGVCRGHGDNRKSLILKDVVEEAEQTAILAVRG